MICPINWTRQHTDKHYPINCGAFVKVHDSKFVPQTGSPGKPFTNLVPPDPTSLSQVKAQYLQ
jgi:hypothetical protein